MEIEQRPPVTLVARDIKITKGSSRMNTKHELIMCSSYPLMIPTSLHKLVVSCQMGNHQEVWGLEASLQEILKCK